MYHEERVIDGKLQWRSTPNGEFQEYSQRDLTIRLLSAESALKLLQTSLELRAAA